MSRDPYCGNCKYSLKGLTESSKCPECGKPLVEVLERGPISLVGRRYRSEITLFGLPLLDIATGPRDNEPKGQARGIIAIGDIAIGWLAIGGFARGVIALGGFAVGVVALGGLSAGLITFGGLTVGLLAAYGGLVSGGVVSGGLGLGWVVAGAGLAIGHYAAGGLAWGHYVMSAARRDPAAIEFFRDNAWIFGGMGFMLPVTMAAAAFGLLVVLFLIGLAAYLLRQRQQ
jgi:hypothetical protein